MNLSGGCASATACEELRAASANHAANSAAGWTSRFAHRNRASNAVGPSIGQVGGRFGPISCAVIPLVRDVRTNLPSLGPRCIATAAASRSMRSEPMRCSARQRASSVPIVSVEVVSRGVSIGLEHQRVRCACDDAAWLARTRSPARARCRTMDASRCRVRRLMLRVVVASPTCDPFSGHSNSGAQ
jgi:hypothetical protein